MHDQANELRNLIRETAAHPASASPRRARRVVITSGKGGVGKSNLSLNLAIALAQRGRRVVLLDADLGLANLEVLCQLDCPYNLSHVLCGARELSDVLVSGPAGVRILPGAGGISSLADAEPSLRRALLAEFDELEAGSDELLVDTGSGLHRAVREFIVAADRPILVATPEPTAITDAYAVVKALAADRQRIAWRLVVNQADSPAEAQHVLDRIGTAARRFLGIAVPSAGFVPADPHVPAAVRRRRPVILEYPACPASCAIRHLAEWLTSESCLETHPTPKRTNPRPPLFAPVAQRLRRAAAL